MRHERVKQCEIVGPDGERTRVQVREDWVAQRYRLDLLHSDHIRAIARYRRDVEAAAIGAVRAIDPAREAVDGGRVADTLSASVMQAAARVLAAEAWIACEVGRRGVEVMRALVIEGREVKAVAARCGWGDDSRSRHAVAMLATDAITALAAHYDVKHRQRGA